jgi:hypothetical protein
MPFRWESLRGWDFRPQLIVVSGLFGGNPFVDGILGFHRAFFHKLFFFSQWNSGYQEALHTNFSFFTTEFWLSGSLSHDLFSFFSMEFWLSGSLCHELFSFFTMELWLSGSLSCKLFSFFTMEFWLSGSLSHELFSFFTMEFSKCTIWGKTLFIYIYIYIYIYHKEYLHRIHLVKNLAS